MKANVSSADAVLEPELRELVFDQDAAQRAKSAEKFMRWADQLTESVIIIDPDLVVMVPPPKVSRGFVKVQLAQWAQDDLRDAARECGLDLRAVLRWAFFRVRQDLDEKIKLAKELGIHPKDCWGFFGVKSNRN